jgi:hypothetical protein
VLLLLLLCLSPCWVLRKGTLANGCVVCCADRYQHMLPRLQGLSDVAWLLCPWHKLLTKLVCCTPSAVCQTTKCQSIAQCLVEQPLPGTQPLVATLVAEDSFFCIIPRGVHTWGKRGPCIPCMYQEPLKCACAFFYIRTMTLFLQEVRVCFLLDTHHDLVPS